MVKFVMTGANAGVARLAIVEIAKKHDVDLMILTCRSEAKATATIEALVKETGKPREWFDFVVLDLCDYASIAAAAEKLPDGLDRICLNAGDAVGGMHSIGVTKTFMTTLGHSVLVDKLLAANKLPDGSRIFYVSTEGIRPLLGFTGVLPGFGRAGCFSNLCLSSCWGEANVEPGITRDVSGCGDPCCIRGHFLPFRGKFQQYSNAKIVGSLYYAQLAKDHPNLNIITISPGAIADFKGQSGLATSVGFPVKQLMWAFPCLFSGLCLAHPMKAGVERYAELMTGEPKYESGAMAMSGKTCGCCLWGAGGGAGNHTDNRAFSPLLRDEKLYAKAAEVMRKWMAKFAETASGGGGGGGGEKAANPGASAAVVPTMVK